jgi:hypothetical protein
VKRDFCFDCGGIIRVEVVREGAGNLGGNNQYSNIYTHEIGLMKRKLPQALHGSCSNGKLFPLGLCLGCVLRASMDT